MIEHGAYRLLLDRYYGTEAGIPADQVHRIARARTKEEKQAVDVVLAEFFQLAGDVWINKRAEEEIAKAYVKINTAKENGKKGGRPRKVKLASENETQSKPGGFPLGSENKTQSKALQSPVSSHQSPVTSESRVVDVQPESREPPPENATRKGALCRQLRTLGIDAAPHMQGWAELLPAYSDAEILAAAEQAREKKPGERLHLNYLLPMLRDRAAPREGKPGQKFDPVAHVNRNRKGMGHASDDGNVIDGTAHHVA